MVVQRRFTTTASTKTIIIMIKIWYGYSECTFWPGFELIIGRVLVSLRVDGRMVLWWESERTLDADSVECSNSRIQPRVYKYQSQNVAYVDICQSFDILYLPIITSNPFLTGAAPGTGGRYALWCALTRGLIHHYLFLGKFASPNESGFSKTNHEILEAIGEMVEQM